MKTIKPTINKNRLKLTIPRTASNPRFTRKPIKSRVVSQDSGNNSVNTPLLSSDYSNEQKGIKCRVIYKNTPANYPRTSNAALIYHNPSQPINSRIIHSDSGNSTIHSSAGSTPTFQEDINYQDSNYKDIQYDELNYEEYLDTPPYVTCNNEDKYMEVHNEELNYQNICNIPIGYPSSNESQSHLSGSSAPIRSHSNSGIIGTFDEIFQTSRPVYKRPSGSRCSEKLIIETDVVPFPLLHINDEDFLADPRRKEFRGRNPVEHEDDSLPTTVVRLEYQQNMRRYSDKELQQIINFYISIRQAADYFDAYTY
uniref:Uncharacterized protein n=1 Tax=Rhabditophanes sp. KR3021 TaxID=114890 RepID=A0AC35TG81_9BILA